MKLLVNVGNTTIWFAFWEDGIQHAFKLKHADFLNDSLDFIASDVEEILIASVVEDLGPIVSKRLAAYFAKQPRIIGRDDFKLLKEGPYPFSQLGVDRLLVAEESLRKYKSPLLVCDLGTASTINYINEKNVFEGGLILPGMDMSLSALEANTSKLPCVTKVGKVKMLGQTTEENIRSGIYYSLIMTIEAYARMLNVPVILTGGNSEHLLPYFKIPVNHEPTLLIEGMAHIDER